MTCRHATSGFREQLPPANPFRTDWLTHKSFDGSYPLGPWIVPASEIGDPQNLGLKLWVNDVLKQDSNTGKLWIEKIGTLTNTMA
jgi:2-keto-4-pentenoate hydratase/2-oxohepta-3-ene-1,7-dioic acid hydratase in catechol pathway